MFFVFQLFVVREFSILTTCPAAADSTSSLAVSDSTNSLAVSDSMKKKISFPWW